MADEINERILKKKRKRTIITKTDLEKLEELFGEDKWPDRRRKEQLAKSIRKTENFVNTWFQNRRAKLRRLLRVEAQESDISDDVGTTTNTGGVKLTYHDVDMSKFEQKSVGNGQPSKGKRCSSTHQQQSQKEETTHEVKPGDGLLFSGLSWRCIFQRVIEMAAASEGVIRRSDRSYTDAVRDAALGIKIKDFKLIYNKDYGLDFVECVNTRSSKRNK